MSLRHVNGRSDQSHLAQHHSEASGVVEYASDIPIGIAALNHLPRDPSGYLPHGCPPGSRISGGEREGGPNKTLNLLGENNHPNARPMSQNGARPEPQFAGAFFGFNDMLNPHDESDLAQNYHHQRPAPGPIGTPSPSYQQMSGPTSGSSMNNLHSDVLRIPSGRDSQGSPVRDLSPYSIQGGVPPRLISAPPANAMQPQASQPLGGLGGRDDRGEGFLIPPSHNNMTPSPSPPPSLSSSPYQARCGKDNPVSPYHQKHQQFQARDSLYRLKEDEMMGILDAQHLNLP
ncbi:hypothetical protein T484DRAFT_1814246 [Baffinella frigidus]|nr:hypothetical protein T484DRAFT_1814246 [Cryptophyta sp. CCMP2293]